MHSLADLTALAWLGLRQLRSARMAVRIGRICDSLTHVNVIIVELERRDGKHKLLRTTKLRYDLAGKRHVAIEPIGQHRERHGRLQGRPHEFTSELGTRGEGFGRRFGEPTWGRKDRVGLNTELRVDGIRRAWSGEGGVRGGCGALDLGNFYGCYGAGGLVGKGGKHHFLSVGRQRKRVDCANKRLGVLHDELTIRAKIDKVPIQVVERDTSALVVHIIMRQAAQLPIRLNNQRRLDRRRGVPRGCRRVKVRGIRCRHRAARVAAAVVLPPGGWCPVWITQRAMALGRGLPVACIRVLPPARIMILPVARIRGLPMAPIRGLILARIRDLQITPRVTAAISLKPVRIHGIAVGAVRLEVPEIVADDVARRRVSGHLRIHHIERVTSPHAHEICLQGKPQVVRRLQGNRAGHTFQLERLELGWPQPGSIAVVRQWLPDALTPSPTLLRESARIDGLILLVQRQGLKARGVVRVLFIDLHVKTIQGCGLLEALSMTA
eukprot:m.67416 g.67416  ORF g.67416 m.67416 type:complete len:495 (-) comp7451_c0_seq2:1507-2991(-)